MVYFFKRMVRWFRTRQARSEGRELADEVSWIIKHVSGLKEDVIRDAEEALEYWEDARAGKRNVFKARDALAALLDGPLKEHKRSAWMKYLPSLTVAVVVALLLRSFVFEPFRIPSGSMIPTLQVGDHIYVNKFVYGLRIPFTSNPPRKFTHWGIPERGDVVVFIEPIHNSEDWIKRVVGLPGDRIRFEKHQIYIQYQGKGPWVPVPTRKIDGECSYMERNEKVGDDWHYGPPCVMYEERLGGHVYRVIYDALPPPRPFIEDKVWTVPPGHVFVMGDNRDHSEDSRFLSNDDGTPHPYIPIVNIKGRAEFIWFSPGPRGQRWDRLFRKVD